MVDGFFHIAMYCHAWQYVVCTYMMESILKTINRVKSANYHFNKFLSATAWSSLLVSDHFCRKHCQMTSLFVRYTSIFQGKLPSQVLLKFISSTCTFPFPNLSLHYATGHQVVQPCTNKEYSYKYIQFWLLCHIAIQSLHDKHQ